MLYSRHREKELDGNVKHFVFDLTCDVTRGLFFVTCDVIPGSNFLTSPDRTNPGLSVAA